MCNTCTLKKMSLCIPETKWKLQVIKTTSDDQTNEDDKWGHSVEQAGGPTSPKAGRPTYHWWDATWPIPSPTSGASRRLVGPTWRPNIGRPTWESRPPKAVASHRPSHTCPMCGIITALHLRRFGGRFDPREERWGAHGSLTWHFLHPYSTSSPPSILIQRCMMEDHAD